MLLQVVKSSITALRIHPVDRDAALLSAQEEQSQMISIRSSIAALHRYTVDREAAHLSVQEDAGKMISIRSSVVLQDDIRRQHAAMPAAEC